MVAITDVSALSALLNSQRKRGNEDSSFLSPSQERESMAKLRYSIPGPGGSLGACAVCGKDFLKEILLGQSVDCVGINGLDKNLPVHAECGKTLVSMQGKWEDIRESFPRGPMYDCFEEEYQSSTHGRQ
jgi:hypothetical protein